MSQRDIKFQKKIYKKVFNIVLKPIFLIVYSKKYIYRLCFWGYTSNLTYKNIDL